ncbi:MAG: calcium-binding protein [Marinovum sp.]|nr:calcium-binding protein [Marinovum sp.]
MKCLRQGLLALLAIGFATTASAQSGPQSVTAYVWGNSLFHHLSNSDDTTVPHWLGRLAQADGRELRLDGQWGFVRDFANTLPPQPNWSFVEVRGGWSPERASFANSSIDTVILNPANFIQYQSPDAPYEGGNTTGQSPLSATVDVFSWVEAQGKTPRAFIYEGWAELGQFPPTRRKFRQYNAYALGDYHLWFEEYHAAVQSAVPGLDVGFIPAGSVISGLITDGPLNELRPTDLYLDDAPHGTATTYFLAAMVTYSVVYETPPPANFSRFDGVHDTVLDNYAAVRDYIWAAVQADLDFAQSTAPVPAAQSAATQAAAVEAKVIKQPKAEVMAEAIIPIAAPAPLPAETASNAVGLTNPSLAMGLNGVADWSTQHPFIDIMKTARPWVGHTASEWGAISAKDLAAEGHLDENGWPVSIPTRATQIESFVLTDQHEDQTSITGRYRVKWEGQGDLSIGGIARPERTEGTDKEIWFSYRPSGEGLVAVAIRSVDPQDPIRNIEIVHEDHIELHEAGVIYNPDFIEKIKDLRALRFMDWTFTNGSEKATWADRARPEHYTFVGSGVPVEHLIRLSNLIGADPWVNMPHLADDDFMRRYATAMRDGLDPRLKVYVEYSNEVWNFIFQQAVHARDMAKERWGRKAKDDAWMQWAGLRAAQMADIWNEVYAGDENRVVPTIGVHSGWLGLEEPLLEAPLWVAEGNTKPGDRFKAYAVTGYFGFELGGDEYAPQLIKWIDAAEADIRAEGEAQGLQRVALREFVEERDLSAAYPATAALLRETSLPELVETLWPYHAKTAASYGMEMVMYEGGTHVAPHGEWSSNEKLVQFMQDFNYSPEMAQIYRELLTAWRDTGGALYNAFVDIAPPSQYGSWGALRHIDDETARWDALLGFNADQQGWWESRRADAFVHGVMARGEEGDDTLRGTTEEDILVGGPGNDTLIGLGQSDRLHGGPGEDTAVMPGFFGDYLFEWDGDQTIAIRDGVRTIIVAVETLQFDDGAIPTNML